MMTAYRVTVFGKQNCDKCKALNRRLDKELKRDGMAEFEKEYVDLDTEQGLVRFCEAECINPQRIPAMLVARRDEQSGRYEPIPAPSAETEGPDPSRLGPVLGLQTDYSERGRGILKPETIRGVLNEARETS
ncbi:hypothetical protein [Kiritimatiella glycovorans]|uniref:Glutaredoxin domain-containing protein n=1 Tax=Kiritimatiella glycovorans TaxID=1307763 RepID=A0A0G3EIB9_9BACT|nr:hypothetical protein [Kiritimatiella glycovorans]AKJ64560.1 hypothetical protein L21SP4_01312 [Kiritimatiella glycovorans]